MFLVYSNFRYFGSLRSTYECCNWSRYSVRPLARAGSFSTRAQW